VCPAADVLATFVAGELSAAEVEALELHLGECSACLAAVAHLGGPADDPDPTLAPGALVDRYQILGLVGRGAFGRVYAAYDPVLDRKVALKLTRLRRVEDEERFLREARAMAGLSSPHVVAVHDVGRVDGALFTAMELVTGQTLRAWLAAEPRPPAAIVAAFVQAGRGLAEAHAAGIVHRDFKPENVLVHANGRVAVTDFGLARGKPSADVLAEAPGGRAAVNSTLTVEGALIGTPRYMSPEGLRREPVDARSDLFAFCVALYEAVFGEAPFPARTIPELLDAIGRGARVSRDSRVPRHVRDAILAGLSADPARRPRDLPALLRALEHDPQRARTRAIVAGALAVAVIASVGAVVVARPAASRSSTCEQRAHDLVTDVWGPERRAALRAGIEGSTSPLRHDVAGRVTQALGRYAGVWREAWIEACEAGERERQPTKLVASRLACLEQRHRRWSSLVTSLTAPDPQAIIHASSASYALPSVAACADPRQLTEAPLADARTVEAARAIERAQVAADLGQTEVGLAALAAPLALARARADRELEAKALLVEGDLRRAVDPRSAEPALHAAAIAASAIGRLDLEAAAKVMLVQTLAHSQLRLAEIERASQYAAAAATRLGDPMVLADYAYARSLAEWAIGGAERSLPFELATLASQLLVWGPDHPRIAEAENVIAASLVELERVEASVPLQRAALAIRERLQGPDHPEALNARGNLAFALAELGQIDEARSLQEAVAAGRARLFGPDYYLLDETWIRLARLYQWELGRADDALAAARRAVAIDARAFGDDAPEGVTGVALLARILAARGALGEADQHSARALRIAERELPPAHLIVRGALATRGDVLERMDRCADATPLLDRLEALSRDRMSGRGELVIGLHARARCAVRQGDHATAETVLRRALAIREQARGSSSPMIADALVELATFYRRRGRVADARAMAERAVAVRDRVPGVVQARARFERAQTWWLDDPAAARAEAERAAAVLGARPPMPLRREIEQWLAAHAP